MRFLFAITLMVCWEGLLGQVSQPVRWEKENKFNEELYSIVSLHEEGLALVRDLDKYKNGLKIWEVLILDTALQEKWTTELLLREELRFTGYEHTPGKVNLMFRRNQSDELRVEMFAINLSTQEIQSSSTEVKLQIRLTHYTVVDNNSIFGGYVGREPVLIIHDPSKSNNIIVPGFFLTDTELMDVRPNKNNTFNILLSQRIQGEKKIIFRTFDKVGNILIEDEILVEEDKNILSGVTSVLEHDEVLIGGAYSYKNSKQATGVFTCLIDPFSDQRIRYTEFYQLQHFLDYLPLKKAAKIRSKAVKEKNLHKAPDFHVNVGVHRVEEFEGGFALFGEAFNVTTAPTNNLYSIPYYNPAYSGFGNPYAYSPYASRYYNSPYQYSPTRSIEEMRMLTGFVIAFDFKGRRIWDYSIPMGEIRIQGHEQVSDFEVVQNVPYFIYKEEDNLMYSHNKVDTLEINRPNSIPVKLKTEYDQIKDNHLEGNLRHWFDQYFIVWGIQTIKDSRPQEADPTRRVFYINKIKVE